MNTTNSKIPGWRLPGAIGWDGFRPDEMERSVESSENASLVLPAIGSLNFEMPLKIATSIGSLFTSDILQITKESPPPTEKQQKQKAEFSFRRERIQMQTSAVREAKMAKVSELEETTLRISKGAMSTAEVKAVSSATEVGISHVFSIWAKKQAQIKAATQAQKEDKITSTKPGRFMGENELLKGGENQHHFTQVAG